MAPLILSIAFTEANAARVIRGLCAYAGLPESEENAKAALKQLAVDTVRSQAVTAAARAAAGEAPVA